MLPDAEWDSCMSDRKSALPNFSFIGALLPEDHICGPVNKSNTTLGPVGNLPVTRNQSISQIYVVSEIVEESEAL